MYRARDTRLKRDVAIKVLPEEFSRDPDRLARFQREAELLATLNHSNIVTIHNSYRFFHYIKVQLLKSVFDITSSISIFFLLITLPKK